MAIRILKAKQSFAVPGFPRQVREGEIYTSDDPIVQGKEEMFSDLLEELGLKFKGASLDRPEVVETATAEPKRIGFWRN